MEKTITQDNLIRYMYCETSPEEASLIEEALTSDFELKELYGVLQEGKNLLNRIRLVPEERAIKNILNYSRRTAPMEHLM